MRMRERWATVSVHVEYLAKLACLKEKHRRSYTSMVEILIDKALENDALLMPTMDASAVIPATPGEASTAAVAQTDNWPTPYGPGATSR